ncbi:CocE/NonD family hydrolase [Streptomyces polygonati]|uniref:CocE/NonD family hydrolase n=1 Tax=Streptomyces polygonati TaxID=1617087 RepID=A0ABV8HXE2_9ACTN
MDVRLDGEAVMRDGTVLRADIHRPPTGSGPWPVLLARGPYGKQDPGILARLAPSAAARRGYLVVIQDTRGRFASDGDWEPLVNEYDDGYDTVRWAAALPGADGRVAMYGPSYLGHAQWAAAAARPPELVALMPEFTWSEPEDGLLARGGVPERGLLAQWTLGLGYEVLRRRHAAAPRERRRALGEWADAVAALHAVQAPLAAWDPPMLRELPLPGRSGGPAVRPAFDGSRQPGLPTFTVAGWYDAFLQGSLDQHIRARASGHPAALVVGPWSHEEQTARVGARDFGPGAGQAAIDGGRSLLDLRLDWLDAVLGSGPAAEAVAGSSALVFVTGANTWRRLDSWPPEAVPTPWFLRRDGALSLWPPEADEAPDAFRHDPADPAPVRGGALLLTAAYPAGPFDQRAVEARPDVLVWTGPPLAEPLEVVGRVRVALVAAASAGPADWVARLCDVAPDGTSVNLTDGIVRTAGPGPAEMVIDLWSTAHVFGPGHRLRLQVAAAGHPRWENASPRAVRTVFHDPDRPSRIVLPVVGGAGPAAAPGEVTPPRT